MSGCLKPIPWPLTGPYGVCREGRHVASYNGGPGLGLYTRSATSSPTWAIPPPRAADFWGCANCGCAWQELRHPN
jgi:hypothetical protein